MQEHEQCNSEEIHEEYSLINGNICISAAHLEIKLPSPSETLTRRQNRHGMNK